MRIPSIPSHECFLLELSVRRELSRGNRMHLMKLVDVHDNSGTRGAAPRAFRMSAEVVNAVGHFVEPLLNCRRP